MANRTPPRAPEAIDDMDPATWPAEALAALQAVLDASRAAAGQALRDSFDHAGRQMTAAELVAFWNGTPLKAMATVGRSGAPHVAPVHAVFVAGRLRSTIYANAVRRRDLRSNPHVAFTTWGAHGAAVILSGRALEIAGSARDTRPGASGRARRTVALDIEITRIHAMKARTE